MYEQLSFFLNISSMISPSFVTRFRKLVVSAYPSLRYVFLCPSLRTNISNVCYRENYTLLHEQFPTPFSTYFHGKEAVFPVKDEFLSRFLARGSLS